VDSNPRSPPETTLFETAP